MKCEQKAMFRRCALRKDLVTVSRMQGIGRVTLMELSSPPLNNVTLPLLLALNDALKHEDLSEQTDGVVLASSNPNIFSAGLDLQSIENATKASFEPLWYALQDTWLLLNSFRKPLVCAMPGPAIGMGYMLAMCADIRYLTLKGSYHNSFLYLPKGELSIIHYTRTTKQNTRQAKMSSSAPLADCKVRSSDPTEEGFT